MCHMSSLANSAGQDGHSRLIAVRDVSAVIPSWAELGPFLLGLRSRDECVAPPAWCCAAYSAATCCAAIFDRMLPRLAAGAEAKYAAHAGILDSARAIVNDLRKTGVLRKLFHFDPGANSGPQPPPIFPSSRASVCQLQVPLPSLNLGILSCCICRCHTQQVPIFGDWTRAHVLRELRRELALPRLACRAWLLSACAGVFISVHSCGLCRWDGCL